MTGSNEVDPPHTQQLIINKEAVSLTSSLWYIILALTGLS